MKIIGIIFVFSFLIINQQLHYDAENWVKGNSLPGDWRPFSENSPWNKEIRKNAQTHPKNYLIMRSMVSFAKHIRFANKYLIPIWVVDYNNADKIKIKSKRIYDEWDKNNDHISDIPIPLDKDMWSEPTNDGHISIVDIEENKAWELSKYYVGNIDSVTNLPRATTFNVWKLNGSGVGLPNDGNKWQTRGGRGSGFPNIAGVIRPEEIANGEIRHALVFTYPKIRKLPSNMRIFLYPAVRSDGNDIGEQYPVMGMLFQLDPSLNNTDFDKMGLTNEAKIIARALQKYGMYLGDKGGAFALMPQLLGPSEEKNRRKWDTLFPGLYESIKNIPTASFRIVYTGEPTIRGKK